MPNKSDTYEDLSETKGVNENEIQPMTDEQRNDLSDTYLNQDWHTTPANIRSNYNEEKFRYKFKFEQEARFMFGVMMIKTEDGNRKGVRLPMLDYTGKKILGMAKWDEGLAIEVRNARESDAATWLTKRERPLGKDIFENDPISIIHGIGNVTEAKLNEVGIFTVNDYICDRCKVDSLLNATPAYIEKLKNKLDNGLVCGVNAGSCPEKYDITDHRKAANPYLSKYGDEWEDKISKKPALRLVRPVKDLIQHMATTTTDALKNTPYEGKGLFYHDALSQLTERETVSWMKNDQNKIDGRNIYDMWIKPVLGCNDEIVSRDGTINTRFGGRPVGNQPEVQPLDNSLNNDIKVATETQVAATYFLPKGHKKKFTMATREDVVSAVGRCHCPTFPGIAIPTSRRIQQDINKVVFALFVITEAKGHVVKGLAGRDGHRRFVDSFAVDADILNAIDLDLGEDELGNEDCAEEGEANNFICGRWFHPDTRDVLQDRWKEEGNSEEE